MATDLFDRLSELEVPPPPERFDEQLHDRVNRSLFIGQLVDLVVGALPFAIMHFTRSLVGFAVFTATGRYETKPKDQRRS